MLFSSLTTRRAVGLWCVAAALGSIVQVAFYPLVFEWQDLDALPESVVMDRTYYLLFGLIGGAVSLLLFAWALLRRQTAPRWADYGVVLTGLATPLGGPAAVLTLVMIVATLRIRPMLIGLALGAASLVWDARLQAVSGMDTTGAWAIIVAVLAVVGAAGVWLGRRREARVERERAAELELRTVQAEERSRIARDMHDSLSHRLSLISLHAGALAYRPDLDRDTIMQTTSLLQQQAEAATADLRQVLHVLRDPSGTIDPATSVADLVASARQAGTEVLIDDTSLDLARHTDGVSTLAAHTVHRTLQEALTNARKHAPGQPVTLRLQVQDGTLVAEAANANLQPGRGPGHGLIGLAERAEQAGGSLTVTEDDPFRLRLEIPWTTR